VIGGESGPNARPMALEWAFSLLYQLQSAGVPVFVKQMGSKPMFRGKPQKFNDTKGGGIEEWPIGLQVREYPI
jgi:protein gp37